VLHTSSYYRVGVLLESYNPTLSDTIRPAIQRVNIVKSLNQNTELIRMIARKVVRPSNSLNERRMIVLLVSTQDHNAEKLKV
jgi:hypothetical protein